MIDYKEIEVRLEHVDGPLFRVCPKCNTQWIDKETWEIETTVSGAVERKTMVYLANGRPYKGFYKNESRAHNGCGGEMWDVGRVWRARHPDQAIYILTTKDNEEDK